MHRITVSEAVGQPGGIQLAKGDYAVDNVNAGEYLSRFPRLITAEQFKNCRQVPAHAFHEDLSHALSCTAQRILFIRAGGYGDLLFLTPVFRKLKEINPLLEISVSCFDRFKDVLEHNPDVDQILPYPLPFGLLETFDGVVPLENTIECEEVVHAVDRFMAEAGLVPAQVPAEEKACIYHLTEAERMTAQLAWPRSQGKPRLAVQVNASALCRTYSHNHLEVVCGHLLSRDWEIYLFGAPGTVNVSESAGVINLTTRGLSFRHSAAVLATCDVVLAPDSALAHLAGALEIPCVALYGPFPWRLRTAYHPRTFALTGKGQCAPCFHHPVGRQHFPHNGPCAKSGHCEVLDSIEPKLVAARVVALYNAAQTINQHRSNGKLP